MTTNFFCDRLSLGATLAQDDLDAIDALCRDRRTLRAKEFVSRDGDRLTTFPVILQGWAARYQILRNGTRQITGVLLPGDACYYDAFAGGLALEEIIALSPCTVAQVPHRELDRMIAVRPAIARALRNYGRHENAVLSSWVTNMGRRDALERMAHFICEARSRLEVVGEAHDGRFHFPLTQDDFADVVGLTPVHINRKLQQMRSEGLISLRAKELAILDEHGLRQIAGFHRRYLYPPRAAAAPAQIGLAH